MPKTPKKGFKVCVCGGAGSIGQPLCLLMALDPRVWELSIYDLTIAMVPAGGIGADLQHLERKCNVTAYSLETTEKPVDHLKECLEGCSLVLMCAGVPSKGRKREELLKINANIVKSTVEACAKFCPDAVIGLVVNPLSSVVAAMARLYEKAGHDPKKICGITSLDGVRANKFVHQATGLPIEKINVPVVGGYSGARGEEKGVVLPLLSQCPATSAATSEQMRKDLIRKVNNADSEVVEAKKGKGLATLSMAYAAARFGKAVLSGLSGERAIESAFVKSDVVEPLKYFSSRVTFGVKGVEKVHEVGPLSEEEMVALQEIKQTLREEIEEGLVYAEHTELARG